MFGLFGARKKYEKIIETLTAMASVFRKDVESHLLNHECSVGVNVLKAFSLSTGVIYHNITKYYRPDQCKRLIDPIEQEAFNYVFAMYLSNKFKDPHSIAQARSDFHDQSRQFIVGIPNFLSKTNPSPEISKLIPNSSAGEQAAFTFLYVCFGSMTLPVQQYLKTQYKSFAMAIERFQTNINIYLDANS